MRRAVAVAALAAGLVLSAPAWAQRAVTFGGVIGETRNVPIDTSKLAAPFPQPQLTKPKPGFSLTSLIPKIFLPSTSKTPSMPKNMAAPGGVGPGFLNSFQPQLTNSK